MGFRAVFVIASSTLFIGGCASVTGTSNQPVSVRSTCGGVKQVSGAACKLTNDKGEWHIASTPGSVFIQKAYGDLAVECQKPNLGQGVGVFKSTANASVYGNLLVGGLIGYAIDAGGGSGFDYPQLMTIEICNGVLKADADEPPREAKEWLAHAKGFASNLGCSPSPEVALVTRGGAERYRFACTPTRSMTVPPAPASTRTSLSMECIHGGCREIPPFSGMAN